MKFPIIGLLLVWAGVAVAADELPQATQVRRIQWPVTIEPRHPGDCDGLTADEIVVREDGVQLRVDAIERTPLSTIHAIVIDNSGSMSHRLNKAKSAALAYIERLPAGDPAMLATFSDNLILQAPLTTDRAEILAALEGIKSSSNTALNDAIYYTVNYLAGRPGRKILVLITDGCDSASLPRHALADVVRLAGEIGGLTIFPIGIDLPARCDNALASSPGYHGGPVGPLQSLALNSGGALFRSHDAAALPAVFETILDRVQSEGYITYWPLTHGESRKDRPRRNSRRRVTISSTHGKQCRVESAGPLTRTELAPASVRELDLQSSGNGTAQDPRTLLYRDWWSDAQEEALGRLELHESSMLGRGADLERERSYLYSATAYYLHGKYVVHDDFNVRVAQREYRIDLDRLEQVREQITSPATLLHHLLQTDARPFLPIPGAETKRDRARRVLGERWVHGQTLLELRDVLARGLFTYPDYREFAYERIGKEYRREMSEVLTRLRADGSLNEEEHTQLGRLVEEQRPEPQTGQLQQYLTEWLGDLTALELVVDFERSAVNRLLDPAAHGAADSWIDLIDTKWDQLSEWFPPPTQIRIIAPLVLGYDPDRDLLGFWRILLPEISDRGAPRDAIPPHPLGLTIVRELLAQSDGWSDGVELRSLSYGWLDRSDRRRVLRGLHAHEWLARGVRWREIPVVRLSLAAADDVDPLVVTVVWNRSIVEASPTALCFDLGDPAERPSGSRTDRIRESLLSVTPECPTGPAG